MFVLSQKQKKTLTSYHLPPPPSIKYFFFSSLSTAAAAMEHGFLSGEVARLLTWAHSATQWGNSVGRISAVTQCFLGFFLAGISALFSFTGRSPGNTDLGFP